jgi:hypothetical protein
VSDDVRGSIASIEASLRRLERPALAMLNPGVKSEAVRPKLASRGLHPSSDLLALWEWRDGTGGPSDAKLGDLWLVPGFYLLSVDDATKNFDAFLQSPRWQSGWLPILADGGGDFMALDCSSGDHRGAVYHFRIDQPEHPLEYLTVGQMLATYAAAFQRGVFHIDRDGFFNLDYDAFAQLAADLNPTVPWWRDDA